MNWTPAVQEAWAGRTTVPELDGAFIAFFANAGKWSGGFNPGTITAADLVARIEEPILFSPPMLVSTRAGGKYLSGQRRTVRLTDPYVQGRLQLRPARAETGNALLQAQAAGPDLWMVSSMAFPRPVGVDDPQRVWPYTAAGAFVKAGASAILLSELRITKWAELQGAQYVSGAVNATANYVGRVNGAGP